MRDVFKSATLKLTAWYLLIIMTISIAFSTAIYHLALGEISARFDVVQSEIENIPLLNLPTDFFSQVRLDQYSIASDSLLAGLFYVNLAILVGGGVGSYILARRTLRPIEEANITQSRFIADASHQLRTPLAIIKAELETAQRSKPLTEVEVNEIITSTLEEVDRLSELSGRLLKLSRLEDIAPKDSREAIELDKLLDQVVKRQNKVSNRLHLKVLDDADIQAHPPHIEELFDILLDNALKYSPQGSAINIELKKAGNYASVSVSNTGEGIPQDELDKVFDRFYRTKQSRSSSGYGLGLSIAKQITTTYNGDLKLNSEPNQSTVFTVKLPLLS